MDKELAHNTLQFFVKEVVAKISAAAAKSDPGAPDLEEAPLTSEQKEALKQYLVEQEQLLPVQTLTQVEWSRRLVADLGVWPQSDDISTFGDAVLRAGWKQFLTAEKKKATDRTRGKNHYFPNLGNISATNWPCENTDPLLLG